MPRKSKIATLPAQTREQIEAWLQEHGFASYRELQRELRERGVAVSRASLQRFGSRLEHRLGALRAMSEQARAIVEEVGPREEAEIAAALRRLVQSHLFDAAMTATASSPANGAEPLRPMSLDALAKAFGELERARIGEQRRADALELRLAQAAKIVREADSVDVGASEAEIAPRTLADLRATLLGDGAGQ